MIITYLGLSLTHQQQAILPDRIRALSDSAPPWTKRELLSLLDLLSISHIWIPSFSLITKPLYKATKGPLR